MAEVKLTLTMSLDGYVAGPRQSLEAPLGEGGLALHQWAFATKNFRAAHGLEGGELGVDNDHADWNANVGATIMGRNMFGPVRGPWGEERWDGWWGTNPPFHSPVFVLSHHAREPLELEGGTTFYFVTEGIEAALERALAATDGDVAIGGGAETAQQFLRAGVVDRFEIHVVPLLLGAGARLFERLENSLTGYECVELVSSPTAAHFGYARRQG